MLRSIFSIVLLLMAFAVLGQQTGQGALRQQKEEKDFRPSHLRLSYDMIPLGTRIFFDERKGHELQASIDFYKYFLVFEYGTQKTTRGQSFHYENSGAFFRIGPEVNFLKKDRRENGLTFGLRYAWGHFGDQIRYDLEHPIFAEITVEEENPRLTARWIELTAGIHSRVWKQLYMGYTVRVKSYRHVSQGGALTPYEVPGFGLFENNVAVGFTFYVGWALPFRAAPAPPAEESQPEE